MITDFTVQDILDLSGVSAITDYADLMAHHILGTNDYGDLVVALGEIAEGETLDTYAGDSLTLIGVEQSLLTQDEVSF